MHNDHFRTLHKHGFSIVIVNNVCNGEIGGFCVFLGAVIPSMMSTCSFHRHLSGCWINDKKKRHCDVDMLYFVWHSLFFTTFPVPLSPLKSFHEWIREGSAAFSWEATSYRWPHRHETFTAARIWLLSLHCSSVAKLPTKFHRKEGTLRGCVFPHLSVCMSVSVCLSVCLSFFPFSDPLLNPSEG